MSFDALLKRYFVLVLLGLVALVAYFQASGSMQLLGAAMTRPVGSVNIASLSVNHVATSRPAPRSAEPILARNAFDSVTGPLNQRPAESSARAAPDLSDPLAVPSCEGVHAAIVTESPDPRWSLAALQWTGEEAPKLRRVGDDVGGKQVAYIGYNPKRESPSVWLVNGSSLCQVLLFAPEAPAAAPGKAAATAAAAAASNPARGRRGPPKLSPDIASHIQKISDTEFHLDRAVVDKILENQSELMRAARIVPENKDGQIIGIRLFGIRPDTLLGTLGMQNGDRLESINGFSMTSPEKALEVYARLRSADGLKVQINRRGKPVTIDYKIK